MVALVSQATKKATQLLVHQMQMKSLFFFFFSPAFFLSLASVIFFFFCVCVMLVFFKAKQSQKEEKQIELFFPLFFFFCHLDVSLRLLRAVSTTPCLKRRASIFSRFFFFAPGNSFFEPQLHHRTAS